MKNSLGFKFFLAFLGIGLIVAVAIVSATRISFLHGFSRYAENQEAARMETLAQNLSDAYAEQGNWNFLSGTQHAWRRFLGNQDSPVPNAPARPGPMKNPGGSTPPRLRMALVDMNNKLVAGHLPDHEVLRTPVMLDETQIGWILADGPRPRPAREMAFLDEQIRHGWMIAITAIIMASLVSFLLTRHMLTPIKAMTEATHRLAGGHYDTHVPIASHDEIGQLAGDFNHLATTLARNEKMRRSYMADISHDLRTPLAILRGELEAMEDGLKPASPDNIKALQSEVLTLTRLVEDLHALALSDIGALSYRMEKMDFIPLLRSCLSAFSVRMKDAGLGLEADIPDGASAIMAGDAVRLTQLVGNLLENSLRHTDRNGLVQISILKKDHAFTLEIADSAPAPTQDDLHALTENAKPGRKGLGLAICRKIVEAHNGTMTAGPSSLGGLGIAISLPLLDGEPA